MRSINRLASTAAGLLATLVMTSCGMSTADSAQFFGKVEPPEGQVLRYVTGSEPESLDPQVSTGQPEARIYMSLYEGLTEYDPKTMEPIPAIAESWEANPDFSEFTFHLRSNARFSDGDPITAHDFVYTFRRGLEPSFAARNAYMAYYINYAQPFNEGAMFVRDPQTGEFVMDGSFRLTVPNNDESRAAHPGKELVPVRGEDLGVEAIDDYTLRVTLIQSAPFFAGLVAHQFFRLVPQQGVEAHGQTDWVLPGNHIASGPFMLKEWVPYDKVVVVRNPMYWDAANVRLEEIRFYALEDATTMMNLYKAGEVDATYNHTVPVAWLDFIMPLKDYMDAPEMANEYYQINTTQPPMNDIRVRKAFSYSIDREALAQFRRVAKPLYGFVPEGIFPGYPHPRNTEFNPERAKELLAEAGYKDAAGNFDPSKFPIQDVELTYNTTESNRQVSEFIQAQWKQNLGLTVPLKNLEFRTFLSLRANLEYKGIARSGWIGDYMDPFSYLNIFSTPRGDNGTGWWTPEFVRLLEDANRTLDPDARYRKLAEAETMLVESAAVIPLMTQATNWMKKPYVKGMYPNPGTMHAWKFVYIEYDPANWDYAMPDMTD